MEKRLPVALQLYSVRKQAAGNIDDALAQVKEMGYDGVELAGLYGLDPRYMRAALDRAELAAISAHVPYPELLNGLERTIDAYAAIGCAYIAIPYLDEQYRPGAVGFGQVVQSIRAIGKACADKGITLLYHNHDFEFVTLSDGRIGLDALYAQVPAALLQTQIDTCWARVAGYDPAAYLRKYAGRAPLVHLKDYYLEGDMDGQKPYDLIGVPKTKPVRPANFDEIFSFRPLGQGVQDIPSVVEAAVFAGAKWLVVEQDAASPTGSDMDDARSSILYLRSIGL